MGKKCDCLLPDCPYCHPGILRPPLFDETMGNHKSVNNRFDETQDTKCVFINIYENDKGRFISLKDYTTYKGAYESRDDLSSYIETVEIIRIKKWTKKLY